MFETTTESERRRSVRYPVDLPVTLASGWGDIGGRAINLSTVGVYCLLSEPIPELSSVTIQFALPLGDDGTAEIHEVRVSAVVVRVEATDRGAAAAFMFEDTPIEAEYLLGRYLLGVAGG